MAETACVITSFNQEPARGLEGEAPLGEVSLDPVESGHRVHDAIVHNGAKLCETLAHWRSLAQLITIASAGSSDSLLFLEPHVDI